MALPLKVITPDMLAEDPFRLTRVDFEKDMSAAPLFALALIVVNIAVFAWELYAGALNSREAVIAAGAVYGERVFAGESWRLATGMFLHAGFSHLIGNCLVLYVLGLASEQAWGRLRALQVYFISGLGSSLLTALMQPKPSVGASGAIFGLMGAAIVFFFRHHRYLHPRARRIGAALLGWGLFQLSLGLLSPIVDNWGHLGGLLTGAA
jgi:rhomboid protease GluP